MRMAGLVALLALVASVVVTSINGGTAGVVHADTGSVTLHVVDAKTGNPIPAFQFLINIDNTGTTEQRTPVDGCSPEVVPVWVDANGDPVAADTPGATLQSPGYPDSCHWTSMGVRSSSPIFTQGTQADVAASMANMPAGRYLVSVIADGHKLDGQHFTVPDDADVIVALHPSDENDPLPSATVQSAVFEDISPVNERAGPSR